MTIDTTHPAALAEGTADPSLAACEKVAWCRGHDDRLNPPEHDSHGCAIAFASFDEGTPRYIDIDLTEGSLTISLEAPNDWYLDVAQLDEEINQEIRDLQRARAIAKVFLASIGALPELTIGELGELARDAGMSPTELVAYDTRPEVNQ